MDFYELNKLSKKQITVKRAKRSRDLKYLDFLIMCNENEIEMQDEKFFEDETRTLKELKQENTILHSIRDKVILFERNKEKIFDNSRQK